MTDTVRTTPQPDSQQQSDWESALSAFVALLEREQALLTAGDTEQLHELASAKSSLAERVEACSRAGMNRALRSAQATQGETPRLPAPSGTAGWNLRLLQLAARARELNRVNGNLITQHLTRTAMSLSILNPGSVGGVRNLYGRNGLHQAAGPSRSLGAV